MAKGRNQKQTNDSGLNFEAQLWAAADKMRVQMDASEYNACPGGPGFSDPKGEWFVTPRVITSTK